MQQKGKISSSNWIKSSVSHKNHITEQWRRREKAKGATEIALRHLPTCPHSCVYFLLLFAKIPKNFLFNQVWGKMLQTQHQTSLMWQENSFSEIITLSFPHPLEDSRSKNKKNSEQQVVDAFYSWYRQSQNKQSCWGNEDQTERKSCN